jgi:ActR/RegA family two-component response regulator/cell fate (sporulation/competence/biofilm development) regulator YlbF (YheA/YmcA/DUF963 family)
LNGKTAQPPKPSEVTPQAKEAAKQCLVLADKFIREGDFERARVEVDKAQKLDPSNMYIFAFKDRIHHFEELKKKAAPPPTPPPAKPPTAVGAGPKPGVTPKPAPQAPPQAQPPKPSGTPPPKFTPAPRPQTQQQGSPASAGEKADLESKLDDMRRQIELLTKAIEQEKNVREEMKQHELQGAAKKLRVEMEKVWMNGAPKEREIQSLHELAASMGVPEDVERSLRREVKLDMYSRAVKEVISKRKLLKSSSNTLEWLRKVYQVTLEEYLEYESKFLMDLVADQFKGTILFVSSDAKSTRDLTGRLKTSGFAVVMATSPENALEKIEKVSPHYILCDTQFPAANLSGVKFLHVLRVNPKFSFIPFILLCETKDDLAQLGSSELRPTEGYIEKPADFDALTALMDEKAEAFRSFISSM